MRRSVGRLATATALVALACLGTFMVAFDAVSALTFACYALIGTYLVLRRPRNAVGWLLIVIGWLSVSTSTNVTTADIERIQARASDLITDLRFWVGPAIGGLTFVAYGALAFVFPSGSLPGGRRGRVIAGGLVAATIVPVVPPCSPPPSPPTSTASPRSWSAIRS
jgi:hypothetical protein